MTNVGELPAVYSLVGLPVNVAFMWIGFKKGGWWHILTVLGAGGALFNVANLAKRGIK